MKIAGRVVLWMMNSLLALYSISALRDAAHPVTVAAWIDSDQPDITDSRQDRQRGGEPFGGFSSAAERPLFHRTRRALATRPEIPAVQIDEEKLRGPVPEPSPLPNNSPLHTFVLRCSIIAGEKRLALFEGKVDKIVRRIALGEQLEHWRLTEITGRNVVLEWENSALKCRS